LSRYLVSLLLTLLLVQLAIGLSAPVHGMKPPRSLLGRGDKLYYSIVCTCGQSHVAIGLTVIVERVEYAPPGSDSLFSYTLTARSELVRVKGDAGYVLGSGLVQGLLFLPREELGTLLEKGVAAATVENLGENRAWFLVDKGLEDSVNLGNGGMVTGLEGYA